MSPTRGRHKSTCKDGRKSIEWIQEIEGVKAVILGKTRGRIGRGKTGSVKIQRQLDIPGFKAVLTCSYGLQELVVILFSEEHRLPVSNKISQTLS